MSSQDVGEEGTGTIDLIGFCRDHPVETCLLVGGGALLGALALKLLGAAATGDEPPIRVKGGSVDIELLTDSSTKKWKKKNPLSKKRWKISSGTRADEKLTVHVAKNDGACHKALGVTLTVTHTSGMVVNTVEFSGAGRNLSVDASADLKVVGTDDHTLQLPEQGYISRVQVGTLDLHLNAGELDDIVILDYDPSVV